MPLLLAVIYKVSDLVKPFLITPLFLLEFGVLEFGKYSLILILFSLIYPVFDLGFQQSIQRFFYSKSSEKLGSLLGMLAIQVGVIFLVVCLVCVVILGLYPGDNNIFYGLASLDILVVLIYSACFSVSLFYVGLCRAIGNFKLLAATKIQSDILEFLALICFILISETFSPLYVLLMCFSRIYFIAKMERALKLLSYPIFFDFQFIKRLLSYSLPIVPIALLGSVDSSADRFFQAEYFGLIEVGTYSVIYQYVGYVKFLVFPITFVYFSTLCSLLDEGQLEKYRALVRKLMFITISSTIVAGLIVFWGSDIFFGKLLGLIMKDKEFETVLWCCILVLLLNIISVQTLRLSANNKNSFILLTVSTSAVVNIILNFTFMEAYGYPFAALSSCVCAVLVLIFYSYALKGCESTLNE